MATKTNEEFIDEFKRMGSEKILREYEVKNRQRIAESPFEVRGTFDEIWTKIVGQSYYQPATVIKPQVSFGVNNTERSDPKGCQYRENVVFDTVYWQLLKRKISKKPVDLYVLDGDTNGSRRSIYQNLTIERVREFLGETNAQKISQSSKTNETGSVKGPIEISVEGYWEVVFSPAQNQTDPIDVKLNWEGQPLIIKRMLPVVLPGFYIEVADNATKDNFIQNEQQGRKKVGVIQQFPYTVLRKATREEYLIQKESGDRAYRAKIQRDEQI